VTAHNNSMRMVRNTYRPVVKLELRNRAPEGAMIFMHLQHA
jgi:hypothetical protein